MFISDPQLNSRKEVENELCGIVMTILFTFERFMTCKYCYGDQVLIRSVVLIFTYYYIGIRSFFYFIHDPTSC